MAETNGRPLDYYIRVSRVGDRAGEEAYGSPEIQRQAIRQWAKLRGVELAHEFIEEDETAGERDVPRPELERAIKRALDRETGGIVFYNISRFSRFTEQGLADLRRLRAVGARLVFVSEGMGEEEEETIDTRGGYGKLVFTMLLAMQEAALDQLKAGWRVAKRKAISEGRQIGPTPWGYRRAKVKNGHPSGKLEPDPETAPHVKRAFELAGANGLAAAANYLEQHIPETTFTARKPKTAAKYSVKVGEPVTRPATWNTSTVRRLVRSRVYRGEAFYRYRDGTEELNPAAHEPIVDERIWALAQVAADDTRVVRAKQAFPLSGIATCAGCGNPMIGSNAGDHVRTYRCSSVGRKGASCSARAMIKAEPLERWTALAVAKRAAERAAEGAVPVDTESLGRVVEDAEAELIEWAKMPRADREAIGRAAYEAGRAQRTQERDEAAAIYREAIDNAPPLEPHEAFEEIMHLTGGSASVEGMDGHEGELELGLDLEGLRELFVRGVRSMTVEKGRGSTPTRLRERVTLELR